MQPAQYESVEHILAEIRAMRVRGGSAFGQAAAHAFRLTALDENLTDTADLFATLDDVTARLLAEKPTMATIHNARDLIVGATRAGAASSPLEDACRQVVARSERFIAHSLAAVAALGAVGGGLVADDERIMMHSFSESVLAVFAAAVAAGKRFAVICTESRPLREGRFAAARLSAMGVPVTFVADAAMAEMVREADWCLIGADAIRMDGAVANKMGSSLLALVAERLDRPLYVAAEALKLRRDTARGARVELERRPAAELLAPGELEDAAHVTVRNQFFDLTPPGRIRGIITEAGIFPPANIARAWDAVAASIAELP